MKVEFHVLRNEAGGVAVLPPERRMKAAAAALRKKAEDEDLTEEEAKRACETADRLEREWEELKKKFEGAETVSFEVRPYTYGEKLRARKCATTWQNGTPGPLDTDEYVLLLTMASTGMSREEVEALPPALYTYLSTEILEISEPDPAKLDFFNSSPSG